MDDLKKKLIEDNIDVVDAVLFSYTFDRRFKEDLRSEGYLALCKAADRYDEDQKCTFKTFASRCIYNRMVDWVRRHADTVRVPYKLYKEGKRCQVEDFSSCNLKYKHNFFTDLLRNEREKTVDKILRLLDKDDAYIISSFFGIDCKKKSASKLAREKGVCAAGIRLRIKKCIDDLKEYVKYTGLADEFNEDKYL